MKISKSSFVFTLLYATLVATNQPVARKFEVNLKTLSTFQNAINDPNLYIEKIVEEYKKVVIPGIAERLEVTVPDPLTVPSTDSVYGDSLKSSLKLKFGLSNPDALEDIFSEVLPDNVQVIVKYDQINPDWNENAKQKYINGILYALDRLTEEEVYTNLPYTNEDYLFKRVNLPQMDLNSFLKNQEYYYINNLNNIKNTFKMIFRQKYDVVVTDEDFKTSDPTLLESIKLNIQTSYDYLPGGALPTRVSYLILLTDINSMEDEEEKKKFVVGVLQNMETNFNSVFKTALLGEHIMQFDDIYLPPSTIANINRDKKAYIERIYQNIYSTIYSDLEEKSGIRLTDALRATPEVSDEYAAANSVNVQLFFKFNINGANEQIPDSAHLDINLEELDKLTNENKALFIKAIFKNIRKTITEMVTRLTENPEQHEIRMRVNLPNVNVNDIVGKEEDYYIQVQRYALSQLYTRINEVYGIKQEEIINAQEKRELIEVLTKSLKLELIFGKAGSKIPTSLVIIMKAPTDEQLEVGLSVYFKTLQNIFIKALQAKLVEAIEVSQSNNIILDITLPKFTIEYINNNRAEYITKIQQIITEKLFGPLFAKYNLKKENVDAAQVDNTIAESLHVEIKLLFEKEGDKIPNGLKVIYNIKEDVAKMAEKYKESFFKTLNFVVFSSFENVFSKRFAEEIKINFPVITEAEFKANPELAAKTMFEAIWILQSAELAKKFDIKIEEIESARIDAALLQRLIDSLTLNFGRKDGSIVPIDITIRNAFVVDKNELTETQRLEYIKTFKAALAAALFKALNVNIQVNNPILEVKVAFPEISMQQIESNRVAYINDLFNAIWKQQFEKYFANFGVTIEAVNSATIDNTLVNKIVNDIFLKLEYKAGEIKIPSGADFKLTTEFDLSKLSTEEKLKLLKAIEVALKLKLEAAVTSSLIEGKLTVQTFDLPKVDINIIHQNIEKYILEVQNSIWAKIIAQLNTQNLQIDFSNVVLNEVLVAKLAEKVNIEFKYSATEKILPSQVDVKFKIDVDLTKLSQMELLEYFKALQQAIFVQLKVYLAAVINGTMGSSVNINLPQRSLQELVVDIKAAVQAFLNIGWNVVLEALLKQFGVTLQQVQSAQVSDIDISRLASAISIKLNYNAGETHVPSGFEVQSSYKPNIAVMSVEEKAAYIKAYQLAFANAFKIAVTKTLEEGRNLAETLIVLATRVQADVLQNFNGYFAEVFKIIQATTFEKFAALYQIDITKLNTVVIDTTLLAELDKKVQIDLEYNGIDFNVPSAIKIANYHQIDMTNWTEEQRLTYVLTLFKLIEIRLKPLLHFSILNGKVSTYNVNFPDLSAEFQSNQKVAIEKLQKLTWDVIDFSKIYKVSQEKFDAAKIDLKFFNILRRNINIQLENLQNHLAFPNNLILKVYYTGDVLGLTEEQRASYLRSLQLLINILIQRSIESYAKWGQVVQYGDIIIPTLTYEEIKNMGVEKYILDVQTAFINNYAKFYKEILGSDVHNLENVVVDDVIRSQLEEDIHAKLIYNIGEQRVPSRIIIKTLGDTNFKDWTQEQKDVYLKTLITVIKEKINLLISQSLEIGGEWPAIHFDFPEYDKVKFPDIDSYINEIEKVFYDSNLDWLEERYKVTKEDILKSQFNEKLYNDLIPKLKIYLTYSHNLKGAIILLQYAHDSTDWELTERATFVFNIIHLIREVLKTKIQRSLEFGELKETEFTLPTWQSAQIQLNREAYINKLLEIALGHRSENTCKNYKFTLSELESIETDNTIFDEIKNNFQVNFKFANEEDKYPIGIWINYARKENPNEFDENKKKIFCNTISKLIVGEIRNEINTKLFPATLENDISVTFEPVEFIWALDNIQEYVQIISQAILTTYNEEFKNENVYSSATIDKELAKKILAGTKIVLLYDENEGYLPLGANFQINFPEFEQWMSSNKAVLLKTIQSVVYKYLEDKINEDLCKYYLTKEIKVEKENTEEILKNPTTFALKLENDIVKQTVQSIEDMMEFEINQDTAPIIDEKYAASLENNYKFAFIYDDDTSIPSAIKIRIYFMNIKKDWSPEEKQKYIYSLLYSMRTRIGRMYSNGFGYIHEDYSHDSFIVNSKAFSSRIVDLRTRKFSWVKEHEEEYVKEVFEVMFKELSKVLDSKLKIKLEEHLNDPKPDEDYIDSVSYLLDTDYIYNKYGLMYEKLGRFPSGMYFKILWKLYKDDWDTPTRIKFALAMKASLEDCIRTMVKRQLGLESSGESEESSEESDVSLFKIPIPNHDLRRIWFDEEKYSKIYYDISWKFLTKTFNEKLNLNIDEIPEGPKDENFFNKLQNAFRWSYGEIDARIFPTQLRIRFDWKQINFASNEEKTKFVQTFRHFLKMKIEKFLKDHLEDFEHQTHDTDGNEYAKSTILVQKKTRKYVKENRQKYFDDFYTITWRRISNILANKLNIKIDDSINNAVVDEAYADSLDNDIQFNFIYGRRINHHYYQFPSGLTYIFKWSSIKPDWTKQDRIKFAAAIRFILRQTINDMIDGKLDEESGSETKEEDKEDDKIGHFTIRFPKIHSNTALKNRRWYLNRLYKDIWGPLSLRFGNKLKISSARGIYVKVDEAYIKSFENILKFRYIYDDHHDIFPVSARIFIDWSLIKSDWSEKDKYKFISALRFILRKKILEMYEAKLKTVDEDEFSNRSDNRGFRIALNLPKVTFKYVSANRQEYETKLLARFWDSLSREINRRFGLDIWKQVKDVNEISDDYKNIFNSAVNIKFTFERTGSNRDRRIPFGAGFSVKWSGINWKWNVEKMVEYASALKYYIRWKIQQSIDAYLQLTADDDSDESAEVDENDNIVGNIQLPKVEALYVKENRRVYSMRLQNLIWKNFSGRLRRYMRFRLFNRLRLSVVDKQYAASIESALKMKYEYAGKGFPTGVRLTFNLKSIQPGWKRLELLKFAHALYYNINMNIEKMIDIHLEEENPVQPAGTEETIKLTDSNVEYVTKFESAYRTQIINIIWDYLSKKINAELNVDSNNIVDRNANIDPAYERSIEDSLKFEYEFDERDLEENKEPERKMPPNVKITFAIRAQKTMNDREKAKYINTIYYMIYTSVDNMIDEVIEGKFNEADFKTGSNDIDITEDMPTFDKAYLEKYQTLYVNRIETAILEKIDGPFKERRGFSLNIAERRLLRSSAVARTMKLTFDLSTRKMNFRFNIDAVPKTMTLIQKRRYRMRFRGALRMYIALKVAQLKKDLN